MEEGFTSAGFTYTPNVNSDAIRLSNVSQPTYHDRAKGENLHGTMAPQFVLSIYAGAFVNDGEG